jgi:hypothetical protein
MPSAEALFPTVLFVVVFLSCVAGIWSAMAMARLYDNVGAGGLDAPFTTGASESSAERTLEIRQLVQARSLRRQQRGLPALDVEAEIARLI